MGPSCSPEAREMIPVITGAGLSMVSPSNTLPDLTDPGTPGYFRAAWNDLRQAEVGAEYAVEIGAGTAAIIRDESGYSIGLGDAFAAKFTQLAGVDTITAQVDITTDQTDMLDLLDGIAVSNAGGPPDFLYLPVSMPAGGYIVNQARAMPAFLATYMLGPDSLFDRMLMLSTGTDGEGFLLTGPDDTQFDPAYGSSFLPAYFAEYGVYPDGPFAPYGYDTFNIIAVAIEAAATDLGGGAHLVGRQALRDALFATDYAGLTDTFSCEDNGECSPSPALGIFEVHKNEWGPTHIYPIP